MKSSALLVHGQMFGDIGTPIYSASTEFFVKKPGGQGGRAVRISSALNYL
jgi:hypothetical protein